VHDFKNNNKGNGNCDMQLAIVRDEGYYSYKFDFKMKSSISNGEYTIESEETSSFKSLEFEWPFCAFIAYDQSVLIFQTYMLNNKPDLMKKIINPGKPESFIAKICITKDFDLFIVVCDGDNFEVYRIYMH
jgi:hypothetical protein